MGCTRVRRQPACATSRAAPRSSRRGSARSTRMARSRHGASVAKRRSQRPARTARRSATRRTEASRRGSSTRRSARSTRSGCRARRSSGPMRRCSTSPATSRVFVAICRPRKGRSVQTPGPFEYERATSVDAAIAALERLGPGARIIAGGHSLLPMMKLRLATPTHVIDINDLADLAYIREGDGEVRIGAMTRHVELAKSELLARHLPLFRDAEEVIADPVVRNRGTIGGSLCQADAAEDLSAVCSAVKARVVIRGAAGERVVGMEDFHVGPFTTAVGAGEMLTEIRLPLRAGAGSTHEKVERRAGDWAIAAASVAVWVDGGRIEDAGIALSAVGMTTIHLTRAEELVRRRPPSDDLFAEAGEIASTDCSPSADGRGPIDYKRHLAGVLTQRALRRATARALHQEA